MQKPEGAEKETAVRAVCREEPQLVQGLKEHSGNRGCRIMLSPTLPAPLAKPNRKPEGRKAGGARGQALGAKTRVQKDEVCILGGQAERAAGWGPGDGRQGMGTVRDQSLHCPPF